MIHHDLMDLLTDDLKLNAEQITPTASLDAAGFDSLAVVELSVLLADRYGIDVPDAAIKATATLADLDQLIQSKRSER
ncbi:acyl carrier protein [Streptomyces sp. NPDC005141]